MIRSALHSALLRLPPEVSHHVAMHSLDALALLPCALAGLPGAPSGRAVNHMGISFPNGVGLAAGLDKNADHIDALGALGFGFIEVGTVTPLPQSGNPQPRLFRLPEHRALINRMGFNNKGLDHAVARAARRRYRGVLGFNIGKNAVTPVERAVDDYLIGLKKAHPVSDYITINLSSPNTPNLRDLQYGEPLRRLLTELREAGLQLDANAQRHVPLVVKIAPDMADEDLDHVASTLLELDYAAVIATNTTLERGAVQDSPHASERGGLSGAPLRERATQVAGYLRQRLAGRLPIIGVGGIDSDAALHERLTAGADLIQVYTGFVYRGVDLIPELLEAWNSAGEGRL
jgi:dihydroorotate dehydrogenase